MVKKQYSIGEFATMNKVSARMLRHYDKIGLLRPASVLQNGYRCYSDEQIGIISQIKQLRGCGFLLEEISGIMQNGSPQFLAEEAKRKLAQLQGQAFRQQAAVQSLNELAQEKSSADAPPVYGISLTARGNANLLMQIQPVSLDDVEDAFDALFGLLQRKKLRTAGCAVLLNRLDCPDEEHNQVGVPISETYCDEYCQTLLLPSSLALSVIHYGDYYKIGHAYSVLLNYAEQNSYSIDRSFMERYFVDSSHGAAPNAYVTEISVALKNTA